MYGSDDQSNKKISKEIQDTYGRERQELDADKKEEGGYELKPEAQTPA